MAKREPEYDGITPDARNANRGTERGRYMVEASLRETGAGRSILTDKAGRIIAGNKTFEAASDIGLPVRIVETDGTELIAVKRTDLDLSDGTGTARKLAYYDNRTSAVGLDFDPEIVFGDLQAGLDLSAMFTDGELDELMHAITAPPTLDELEEKYGNGEDSDFWPVIKVQVSPETKELYDSLWRDAPGITDSEKFAALLGAVDAAALGAE